MKSLDKLATVNYKILPVILGLSLVLLSCNQQNETGTAVLTGQMNINWSNTATLSSGAVTLTDAWIDRLNPGDSIINLGEDGNFRIEIALQQPDFYTLSHENNSVELFLSPGDSLGIDFSSEAIVSGTSEAVNGHLQSLRNIINANRRYINGLEFYTKPIAAVDAILDSLDQTYRDAHRDFKNAHPVHDRFEQKVLADITYRHKLYKIVHPPLYDQKKNEKLPIETDYYDAIAQGSFDDPELLKSFDYILFLDEYVNGLAAGAYKYGNYFDAPIQRIHPRYHQISQLEVHQEIKDYLLHQHLHKSMDNYGVVYLQDLLPQFREDCKNPEFVKEIEARFDAGMERRSKSDEIKIYKTIGDIQLEAHIFYPDDFQEGDRRPAYVFFHGGGWAIGVPEWGYRNCEHYRDKGMVAISFEYRLIDIHGSNLLDCVRDAKSAVQWTRSEAQSLGIDPDKIVAAGFSAGGHLAACTAILDTFEDTENSVLSSKPNAIIVHSASYNTLKNSWFARHSEQDPEAISTFHQVDKGLVPSIFFHGTDDHLAPISEFTEFRDKMDALGNDYQYKIFENVGHFFNNPAARKEVLRMSEEFLGELGYIDTSSGNTP
ncbi:MAG: alpha/beta hydrolase [Bacteroidota bacterium]